MYKILNLVYRRKQSKKVDEYKKYINSLDANRNMAWGKLEFCPMGIIFWSYINCKSHKYYHGLAISLLCCILVFVK